jgi:hypothetical protein
LPLLLGLIAASIALGGASAQMSVPLEAIIRFQSMGHRLIHRARKGGRLVELGITTIIPGRAADSAVVRVPSTRRVLATLETSGLRPRNPGYLRRAKSADLAPRLVAIWPCFTPLGENRAAGFRFCRWTKCGLPIHSLAGAVR